MNAQDRLYLEDMLREAREAVAFAQDTSQNDLNTDRKLQKALVLSVGLIGEAASKVSLDYRQAHPNIPWRVIIDTRNFMFHAYAQIDNGVLWETVTENLPPLIRQLETLLTSEA